MTSDLREAALEYHRLPTPGKIRSPQPNRWSRSAISRWPIPRGSPRPAWRSSKIPVRPMSSTTRSNLVAVVTNGTAVLGLGNIGPLAGKPVIEGKGCLFKKFAGIDVFDIELAENDPDQLIETIARSGADFRRHQPRRHQGAGVLLHREALRKTMKIPVFHDDQHGTAIIAGAALINGLKLVGKDIADVRLVCSGAGAAAIACIDLAVRLGLDPKKVLIADRSGVSPRPARPSRREQGALRQ